MTKRTTTKLFAVVALATATTACTATSRTPRTVVVHEPVVQMVRPAAAIEKPILQEVKAELQVSTPRMLKTGAPACGNTQGKMKRDGC